ncbi:unnamed protein product [Arctogadus glacialis]
MHVERVEVRVRRNEGRGLCEYLGPRLRRYNQHSALYHWTTATEGGQPSASDLLKAKDTSRANANEAGRAGNPGEGDLRALPGTGGAGRPGGDVVEEVGE